MTLFLGLTAVGTVGTVIVSLVQAGQPLPGAAPATPAVPAATTSTTTTTKTPPATTTPPAAPAPPAPAAPQLVSGKTYEIYGTVPLDAGGVPLDAPHLTDLFTQAGWALNRPPLMIPPASGQTAWTYDVVAVRSGATIDIPSGVSVRDAATGQMLT